MGLLGKLLGTDRTANFVRGLVEKRMRSGGVDDFFRADLASAGLMALMGTPEGTIYAITRDFYKSYRKNPSAENEFLVIKGIENFRSSMGKGTNWEKMTELIKHPPKPKGNLLIELYCLYRVEYEYDQLEARDITRDHIVWCVHQCLSFCGGKPAAERDHGAAALSTPVDAKKQYRVDELQKWENAAKKWRCVSFHLAVDQNHPTINFLISEAVNGDPAQGWRTAGLTLERGETFLKLSFDDFATARFGALAFDQDRKTVKIITMAESERSQSG